MPSLRKLRPSSYTRSIPPTSSLLRYSSREIRSLVSMPRASWNVVNGRAFAPPATVCSIGPSTSTKPRSWRTSRSARRRAARAARYRRGVSSAIRWRYRRRCWRSGSLRPCHFSGSGRSDFVSIAQRSTKMDSSPRRVVPTSPIAAMMSPRSTSSRRAKPRSSRSAWLQTSWMSPLPSRSVRNFSFPMSRFRTTRPATATVSPSLRSGGRLAKRSRSAEVATGWSTPSASRRLIANALSPSRSKDPRRARRTSSSRDRPPTSPCSVIHVLPVNQPEALQCQEGLMMVDRPAVRDHHRGKPSRGDRRRAAQLVPDPIDDAVDLAGRPEHKSRLDRLHRVLPDHRRRSLQLDAGEAGGTLHQRGRRDLQAGGDHPTEELAVFGDDVEVRAGPEVDDDRRTTEARVGRERVDDPVRTDLARIVRQDRDTRLRARTDDQRLGREVTGGHLAELLGDVGDDRRHAQSGELLERQSPMLEESGEHERELVRGTLRLGGETPSVHQLGAVEDPEHCFRVADIGGEQHRGLQAQVVRSWEGRSIVAHGPGGDNSVSFLRRREEAAGCR